MTSDKSLVPKEVSHNSDLANMTATQTSNHHTQELRRIGFYQGKDGIDAYKQRHPDAARHRVQLNSLAYVPKPTGYIEVAANTVALWFDSAAALAATNRADVERLNARLGTDRFDPGSHFSKAMSPALRKRVAAIFAQRGAALPPSATSLSAAKRAARAFNVAACPDATPFGYVGSRTATAVVIGQRTFAIVRHGDRECLRVTVGGKTQRVSLDVIETILSGLSGGIGGETSDLTTACGIADVVQNTETGVADPLAGEICGRPCPFPKPCNRSAADVVQTAPDGQLPEPLSLVERIRLLAIPNAANIPAQPTDRDPLELAFDDG